MPENKDMADPAPLFGGESAAVDIVRMEFYQIYAVEIRRNKAVESALKPQGFRALGHCFTVLWQRSDILPHCAAG